MRRTPLTHFVIIAAVLMFVPPQAANAGVEGAVAQGIATALAGKTVSDIINEIRLSGVSLIDQATHSGNALIARAGNEAGVLSKNLDFLLKDDINLTFDKLSEERRAVLIQAEAIRRDLVRVADAAYSFKDTTVLDLNALAAKLPFVKKSFFVQSVRGLAYLPQGGDLRLQVMASTLGIDEDISTQVHVYRGHGGSKKLIPNVTVDQAKQRFVADVAIPQAAVLGDFGDLDLKVLPLTLRFDVTQETGWWIFGSTKKQTYEVPIHLSLFPRTAASIVAETAKPTYAWVGAGTKSDSYSTPNRHCAKKCRGEPTRGGNRIEFAVAGGPEPYRVGFQRLVNPRQSCIGGNCAFSDSFNLGVTDNGTRLIFTWDTWSTPGTWQATADVQEYRVTGEAREKTVVQQAMFGKIVEVVLPSDVTFAVLRVRTFTKQEYEVVIGEPDPNGILTYQGKSPSGPGQVRVAYRVNDPAIVAASRLY